VYLAVAGGCSLVILYVATRVTPLSLTFVQAASGVIVGMFLQPSSSGIVALVTAGFSLVALGRSRSFIGGVALLGLGLAAGRAVLILTSTTPARC
jgi:hypothetical protein